jgi:hypothetical protein
MVVLFFIARSFRIILRPCTVFVNSNVLDLIHLHRTPISDNLYTSTKFEEFSISQMAL